MKSLLLLAAVIVCFSAYAASEPNTGAWTAELDGDELLGTIFQRNSLRDGKRLGPRAPSRSMVALRTAPAREREIEEIAIF